MDILFPSIWTTIFIIHVPSIPPPSNDTHHESGLRRPINGVQILAMTAKLGSFDPASRLGFPTPICRDLGMFIPNRLGFCRF